MPRAGFATLNVRSQVYDLTVTKYEQKVKSGQIKDKSFSRYVNDLIMENIEAAEVRSLAAPHIEKSALVGNSILLKDPKLGRMFEAQIRGKERGLFCTFDKRNDCVHVGYTYAIPQVYASMKKIKH